MTTLTLSSLQKSFEIALEVFKESHRLKGILENSSLDIEEIYNKREQYLLDLVGENGFMSFHPTVTQDLLSEFQNAFPKRGDGMPNYSSEFVETHAERVLSRRTYESMTVDNLLNNTLPQYVQGTIRDNKEEFKGYNSPKLSKLLVKLWGEKSDIVKWYTNKCPKSLTKGELKDYKITLSVLPHHIAGMSYYSPINHGGSRWIDGWEGSSCMDTKRNGGGDAITRLLPNLMDSELAVVYLSHADDNDAFNPKYLARMLVRIVNVDGKYAIIGLRTYSISNEARTIIIDGLRNQFDNFASVYDIREKCNDSKHWKDYRMKHVVGTHPVRLLIQEKYECGLCDGDGTVDDGDRCHRCDGTGKRNNDFTTIPYIDDSDMFTVDENNKMVASIPMQALIDIGVMDKEVLEKILEARKARLNDNLTFAC